MRGAGADRYTSARLSPASPRPLPHAFYARDAVAVARDLLGKVLVHKDGPTRRAARIVETEAYHGPDDQASHARFGRTPRAAIMFGPAGVSYVYLIYGRSHCFNVVTGEEGHPSAVLVRAGEPLEGCLHATIGPGNLCRALAIRRPSHNGLDLTGGVLFVEDAAPPAERLVAAPRVNVGFAGRWADRPWRFALEGSPFVSRPWPWAAPGRRRPAPGRAGGERPGARARGAGPRRGRAVRSPR